MPYMECLGYDMLNIRVSSTFIYIGLMDPHVDCIENKRLYWRSI